MTALPALCRKTNDAPRVPSSTAWRVRRSRAERPGGLAFPRVSALDFVGFLRNFALSRSVARVGLRK
jgi:hypothetical protein